MTKVEITSKRKGGNPGGACQVSNSFERFSAYFKYCYGTHFSNGEASEFNAHNQPVYEAMTFELARRFGLRIPETYVLINRKRNVQFSGWENYDEKDPSGRDFYFVSRIIKHPKRTDEDLKEKQALERDAPYLDALLISDIKGRKQNYAFEKNEDGERITYLDLGCSFVHAKEGYLRLFHKLRIESSKDFKRAMKKLTGKKIISANPERDKVIDLGKLVEEIGFLPISVLNPNGHLEPWNLISYEEIYEAQRHIAQGFLDALPKFEVAGYLV